MGVFKVLGKMVGGFAKGATKQTAKVGAAATHDAFKLGKTIINKTFTNRFGVETFKEFAEKPLKEIGKEYVSETLARGDLVPFKMRKGTGKLVFGGVVAYSLISGAVKEKDPLIGMTPEELEGLDRAQIPNTISEIMSPRKSGVDDMGADGDLVFAMHNRRQG